MRVLCWVAVAVLLAGCVKPARMLQQDGRYQKHHEPYPSDETDTWGCMAGRMDVIDVQVTDVWQDGSPMKAVHVGGYTEMPDGSDVVLALRPMGNRLYKTWADLVSHDHRYQGVLGPVDAAKLPPGKYVVEVMWLTHRQEPRVRAEANEQDLNMKHRGRDMDIDHRSSKIIDVGPMGPMPEPEPAAEPAAEGTPEAGTAAEAKPEGEAPAEHPTEPPAGQGEPAK